MSRFGIDISRHQTNNVVKEVAKGGKADFVIVRASIGSTQKDQKFDIFSKDIKDLKFKNGYYCASYAKDIKDAIAEADFIIDIIKQDNNPTELPVFFDWEYFSADYIKEQFGIIADKKLIQEMTVAFCERIKEAGFVPGVYANKDFINRYYTKEFWDSHPDYKFWYARPGLNKPDIDCYLWQYASNNGTEYGYTGGAIDKNILMSDYIDNVSPMQPLSKEPCRMYIGYASTGDIKKLVSKINGLGIKTDVKDGYITTDYVSSGDQCYIMVDCNALGIPYEIYEEREPNNDSELKSLKEENQMLKNENVSLRQGYSELSDAFDKYKKDMTNKITEIKNVLDSI